MLLSTMGDVSESGTRWRCQGGTRRISMGPANMDGSDWPHAERDSEVDAGNNFFFSDLIKLETIMDFSFIFILY